MYSELMPISIVTLNVGSRLFFIPGLLLLINY